MQLSICKGSLKGEIENQVYFLPQHFTFSPSIWLNAENLSAFI